MQYGYMMYTVRIHMIIIIGQTPLSILSPPLLLHLLLLLWRKHRVALPSQTVPWNRRTHNVLKSQWGYTHTHTQAMTSDTSLALLLLGFPIFLSSIEQHEERIFIDPFLSFCVSLSLPVSLFLCSLSLSISLSPTLSLPIALSLALFLCLSFSISLSIFLSLLLSFFFLSLSLSLDKIKKHCSNARRGVKLENQSANRWQVSAEERRGLIALWTVIDWTVIDRHGITHAEDGSELTTY